MKIVIDIPQGLKIDFENENWTALTCAEMKNALMNGTILPEKHGNLIDADVVKGRMIPLDFSVQKWISEVDLDVYVPTIIEADKEV